jgi:hypothetical protein
MNSGSSDAVGGRTPIAGWVLLAVTVAFAFYLRTRDIEAFFVGPDDGSYLHSARVHELSRGGNPLRWIGEDVEWARFLAHNYSNDTLTYQHSYLHQFVTRYLFRFGCGSLQALRLSTAITGTLTALFVAWFFATSFPGRRVLAWIGAALVAVTPLHAFYSRTGWGQIGFTAFYFVYATLLYRVLVVIPADDRRALRRAGWGMLAASLLAYGYHEGVALFVIGSALVAFAAPWLFARDGVASKVLSRRTWTCVWSAAPVGAFTLALALFSSFAQEKWFNPLGTAGVNSYGELKRLSIENLLGSQRPDLMLTWLVIVLAVVGAVAMWKERRSLAKYWIATVIAGTLVTFFLFGDASLLRAYMPVYLIAIVFAAFGLEHAAQFVGALTGKVLGCVLIAIVLATLTCVTWTSLFGRVGNPCFIQHFYIQGVGNSLDYRHVDENIRGYLQEHKKPDERIAIFGDKGMQFRLLDAGIDSREDYLEGPRETWPVWVVGRVGGRDGFGASRFPVEHGGPYKLVMQDNIARFALYRREGG